MILSIQQKIHITKIKIEFCKNYFQNEEIEKRKNEWKPRKTNYDSGTIWKYAQTVGPANEGAVTQPGAKAETHIYADI